MMQNTEEKFLYLLKKTVKTQAEIEELERLRVILEEDARTEQKQLIQDLAENGISVSNVWDLVNTSSSYKSAIQILLEHVRKPYSDKTKEGIVRALAVKEAVGKTGEVLVLEFESTPKEKSMLRWVIGNTMRATISANDIDRIAAIVENKENGISRQPFVAALGKLRSSKVEGILFNLLDDEDVSQEAIIALKKSYR